MFRRTLASFLLAAGVLGSQPGAASDLAAIGPAASAESLLGARPTLREPALEFVYSLSGGDEHGTMTVDLATDFIATRENGTTRIYDYALQRILMIDSGTHTFTNTSLYAQIDFRAAETFNRRYQYRLLQQTVGDDKAKIMAPFWVQSEIHLMDPQDGVPTITRGEATGAIQFSYAGNPVVTFTPSQTKLTAVQGALFGKFLALRSRVHPTIAKQIIEDGHLPLHLTYSQGPMLQKPDAQWDLQSASVVDAIYPLATTDRSDMTKDSPPPLDKMLPLMLSAVAHKAPGMRSAADFRVAIDKALQDGKPFQATMLYFEFAEQYGQREADCGGASDCHTIRDLAPAAQRDSRMPVLVASLRPDKTHADTAIGALRTMKRDDLTNPYVLDDFLANLLVQAGHGDEAAPLFARAILGNPYDGSYYKDLGDLYRFSFNPDAAWLCYDLGRALPGGGDDTVIAKMTEYEHNLVSRYPEFF